MGGDPALQPSTSSGSSGAHQLKEDPDFSKLQERIQKQKEKNARNQRQFRKRVRPRRVGHPLSVHLLAHAHGAARVAWRQGCSSTWAVKVTSLRALIQRQSVRKPTA